MRLGWLGWLGWLGRLGVRLGRLGPAELGVIARQACVHGEHAGRDLCIQTSHLRLQGLARRQQRRRIAGLRRVPVSRYLIVTEDHAQ